MTIPDYTTVIGVDQKHLEQLSLTIPTWRRHKISLWFHPMIVFSEGIPEEVIRKTVDHPNLTVVGWPPEGVTYEGDGSSKWRNPQRHKMLAGFVHVPAAMVSTPYWLKIDTDVIAKGQDHWIDPEWFEEKPAIISHKWSFTRPGNQMMLLDLWVARNSTVLKEWSDKPPLMLTPKPGSGRLSHKRIISQVAFFQTEFTMRCGIAAHQTCGPYQLPVPSQDGFLWYLAARAGLGIKRMNMKSRGWTVRSTMKGIREQVCQAMECVSS